MKRGLVLVAILLAGYFFFHSRKPVPIVAPQPEPVQEAEVTKTDVQEPIPKVSESDADAARLRACWDRINEQTKATGFLNRVDTFLQDFAEPWYYREGETLNRYPAEKPPNLFYAGLARAGLLDRRAVDRDDDEAVTWLKKAAQLDPGNSAPLIFAAAIENRRGHKDESDQLIQQAARFGRRFDTYVSTMAWALFDQVQTPADYMNAVEIMNRMPRAGYSSLNDILKGSPYAELFAVQMMRNGADPTKKLDQLDYSAVEYAYGRALIKDTPLVAKYPTFKEIWEQKKVPYDGSDMLSDLQKACDLSVIVPYVEALRTIRESSVHQ